MRVLVLSALLVCATAAPYGLTNYSSLYAAIPAVPVAVPTISPGDVQAAAINAQVKAEDQARAFADQARELAEQAAENQNEGVIEANDLVKEKSEQAFWNVEEQKWQALDALKTAEAKIGGAVAGGEGVVASAGYLPYVASGAVVSGLPAVIPGYQVPLAPVAVAKAAEAPAAPAVEAVATAEANAAAPEAPKAEEKAEAVVKAAEPEKQAEAEKAADSVQVESAELKASAPEPAKNENPFVIQSFAQTHPIYAGPLAVAPVAPALAYSQPWVAPVAYVQPGLKAVATSSIHQIQGQFIAPTVLKTQW